MSSLEGVQILKLQNNPLREECAERMKREKDSVYLLNDPFAVQ